MSRHLGSGPDPPENDATSAEAGHRLLARPADAILEAWGPDRESCLREAILGMVAGFANTLGVRREASVCVFPGLVGNEDMLIHLLEEVIYLVGVKRLLPIAVAIEHMRIDGPCVTLQLASLDSVQIIGASPKAVTRHELHFAPDPSGTWHVRVLLKV